MDAESAAQVVTRLKSMKVPYQIDPGGGAIRVPSEPVDELRIEFSSQGMPSSGRIGFEIFDRTAFGATEFLEKVNYRRALEGEIARTDGDALRGVERARAHRDGQGLALRRAASGQGIGRPEAARSATALAASSICRHLEPGCRQRRRSSSRKRGHSRQLRPAARAAAGRRRRSARRCAARTAAAARARPDARGSSRCSSRSSATERVRVNVALKLNPQTSEETEERYDPNTVIRSRQRTSDSANMPGAHRGRRRRRAATCRRSRPIRRPRR